MTLTIPNPPPWTRWLPRRLTMAVAAGALTLAGLTTTARPAHADADDILRFLAGALVIGAIVHAIDDNQRVPHYGNRVLPDACLETIRVRGRNIQSYNARCLNRAGYDGLPNRCRHEFRVNGNRTRTGFIAECMWESGYRRQGGGGWQDDGWQGGGWGRPPYGRPPAVHQPPYRPPFAGNARLPGQCSMHYRQSGQRISGFWGDCLRNEGFTNLPRQCRLTSTDGSSIYNARCLYDAGYRN